MAGKMSATAAAAEPVRRAYVTFLPGADDGEGLEAVVRQVEDLRKVDAAYPLVVAVLPDVPESHRRILVSQGCVVREVEPVYPPPEFSAMAAAPRYSMLRVWEFVEYERMVYLDAGIHVLANIDELFDLEEGHFYAVELGGPLPAPYFNAGTMFVHEPSAATAEALLHALRVTWLQSFPGQDFMHMFFRDQYRPIPRLNHHHVVWTMVGYTEHAQVDEARHPWWGEMVPIFGSFRLTNTAKALLSRPNLPAMAALAASSASMGVVTGGAENPAACFSYYVVFIMAIASLVFSLRNI